MRIPRNSPRIEAILSILQFTADSLWKYRSISPPLSPSLSLLCCPTTISIGYCIIFMILRECVLFFTIPALLSTFYTQLIHHYSSFSLPPFRSSLSLVFCLFLSFVTAATLELMPHLRVQDLCKTNPSKFWSFLWFQANFSFRFFSLLLFSWVPLFNLNLFTLKFNIWYFLYF